MGAHLAGRIECFSLLDVFQWLEMARATGRLTVRDGRDRKTIDWKNGDIVYVSGSLPGERLGSVLAEGGSVPLDRLYRVFAVHFSSSERLTPLLLADEAITRDGLAGVVEKIAEKCLSRALQWRTGSFEFDASYGTEDLLQIHLRLKSQAVSLRAARERDHAGSAGRTPPPAAAEEVAEPFSPHSVEAYYWKTRERLEEEALPVRDARRLFETVEAVAGRLSRRLTGMPRFLPPYEDSLREAERQLADAPRKTGAELEGVVRHDPFLAQNLLQLANAVSGPRIPATGAIGAALGRIGADAAAELVRAGRRLDPPLSASSSIARALRRAGIAAAYGAAALAPQAGVPAGEAFAAGLLHGVSYLEVLEEVAASEVPAGPFRKALIETLRPVAGRIRAEAIGLPPDLAAVFSGDARRKNPLAAVVARARQFFPASAVGTLEGDEGGSKPPRALERQVASTFERLGLGSP